VAVREVDRAPAGVQPEPDAIEFKVTPSDSTRSLESLFAEPLDTLVRRTCGIARALTGAQQAGIKLWITDPSCAHKFFSLDKKYAAFRDFRVDPKGIGLHGMTIPSGEVVRLTEAEVLSHPLFNGFVPFSDEHPPMRGWLATSVRGGAGRDYGLLQLSDKSGGRDFDESDEQSILDLAVMIGAMLDGLRLAAESDEAPVALARAASA
jgi:hypothetical protein